MELVAVCWGSKDVNTLTGKNYSSVFFAAFAFFAGKSDETPFITDFTSAIFTTGKYLANKKNNVKNKPNEKM